jgi:iron transport multicopper oxidase
MPTSSVGRTSTDTQPARPVFTVTPGLRYRYRIINASGIAQFNFQIQGHTMTIIEVDGVNHVPHTVDRFTIFAGQRYSVIVSFASGVVTVVLNPF